MLPLRRFYAGWADQRESPVAGKESMPVSTHQPAPPAIAETAAALLDRLAATRHTPLATYRLQFNHTFRFDDARRQIPYLRDLGISDVYASPYLQAEAGSMHGYDIVRHNELNAEIGSVEQYERFVAALHAAGLSQLLDIVPNHMGIGQGNDWWFDVLENGPSSQYAHYFDIDWQPPRLAMANKVLLPVLGDQFGRVLDRGELQLAFADGAFTIHYWERWFPIAPASYIPILQPAHERAADAAPDDEDLLELRSIITSISHLPPQSETDPERLAELYRERLVVRRRLQNLCSSSSGVCRAIDAVVEELNGRQGEPRSFDRLAELLDQQAYRLSYWRVAAEEINYRRFFDVNGLAALRMERPEVFAATHRLILQLLASGKVNGLRIDHPDGLRDPGGYLRRLQSHFAAAAERSSAESEAALPQAHHIKNIEQMGRQDAGNAAGRDEPCAAGRGHELVQALEHELELRSRPSPRRPDDLPLFVLVEKVLGQHEQLPAEWTAGGTTGYDFLNQLNGIFIDTNNRKAFDALYSSFIGDRTSFRDIVYQSKKLVMQTLLSEVNVLALQLSRVAARNRWYRDFTRNLLTAALVEVIACFPIYRTYVNAETRQVSERDRLYIDLAVRRATQQNPIIDPSVFTFIHETLTLGNGDGSSDEFDAEQADFVMKFQQVSSPVMAKGLEDTAFYRYVRLVSLNDVGGDPEQFGVTVAAFHQQNMERQAYWPHSMLATSTHDTKRSEDVRARLNVLSELPSEWRAAVRRWSRLNRKLRQVPRGQPVPGPNDEYLLYQTLVGAWPLALLDSGPTSTNERAFAEFRQRIQAYMEKATREAKVHTSWIKANTAYEEGLRTFIDAMLAAPQKNPFVQDALPFLRRISDHGLYNSLSQTLLKLTCPGVPDIYQGTESWDFSLVDPDNRRPVDFDRRSGMLREIRRRAGAKRGRDEFAAELLATREDGRIKLLVTHTALQLRRSQPELFGAGGDYVPLHLAGDHAEHAVAFLRRNGRVASLTVAPRLTARLTKQDEPPLGAVWGDTVVVLRGETAGQRFRDLFTGATLIAEQRDGAAVLPAASLFAVLPVALLVRVDRYGRIDALPSRVQ